MAYKKGEKITDPVILERLARARKKALETRRKNAAARKDAKLLKAIEKQRERDAVQAKLRDATKKPELTRQAATSVEAKQVKPEAEPKPEVKLKSESEPVSEPVSVPSKPVEPAKPAEELVVRHAPKARKKPRRRKRYVYVSESESSEEEEEVRSTQRRSDRRNTQYLAPTPPSRPPKSRREQLLDRMYTATYGNRRF